MFQLFQLFNDLNTRNLQEIGQQIHIVQAKMQYVYDDKGKRYLDAFAGIVIISCGHCHPDILKAINEQNQLLQHATTIYLHHAHSDFGEALASKMPEKLKVVLFVNSGSEANELAVMLARLYTGNSSMIALWNAYHGGTSVTIGLTALSTWKYPLPQGIGNGVPLGAVVTTPEIASVLYQKIHFNTYGGNPVSSAAGLSVLKVIDKEKRQLHCAEVGAHLIDRLKALQEKHELIGDVRGRGLMVGIELVTIAKRKHQQRQKLHYCLKSSGSWVCWLGKVAYMEMFSELSHRCASRKMMQISL